LIGHLKITVDDLELAPESERILVGGTAPGDAGSRDALPSLGALAPGATPNGHCWCFFGSGGGR
jgi:hypothetical protein